MDKIVFVAAKEFQDALRNRWIMASALTFTFLSVTVVLIGSAPAGALRATGFDVAIAGLSSLTVYFIPLIALMIAHDAIVDEVERGTMLLLLTYPISRLQIYLGNFLGHNLIVGCAILIGYGAAGLGIAILHGMNTSDLLSLVNLAGSSLLLGGVFVSVGHFISIMSSERAMAIGIAIGAWLVIVIIYDLALFGMLVIDQNQLISEELFQFLVMLNPADAFRSFNIAGIEGIGTVTGLIEFSDIISAHYLIYLLIPVGWIVLFGILGFYRFLRYEI